MVDVSLMNVYSIAAENMHCAIHVLECPKTNYDLSKSDG